MIKDDYIKALSFYESECFSLKRLAKSANAKMS